MSDPISAQAFYEPCSRGVIAAAHCPREQGRDISSARRRMVLAACVLASSMAFIDSTALTVALPKLRTFLGGDLAAVQWVLNGYILALASLTLIGGVLADAHGKALMCALGCLLFAAASIACALAPSAAWLIIARVMQGTGAALLTPASLALIGATYPKDQRNSAIGIWAAATALTTAAGPVLGGWLTETFGWQAIFWINPPLALAAVGLLWRYAPDDPHEPQQFDLTGAAIIALSLGALAWALSQIGRTQAQAAAASMSGGAVAAVGVAGLAGLAVFAFWERKTAQPMTPPRLAKNRIFVRLNLATLLVYGAMAIMFFLLPFELVDRRGLTPLDAGLTFLPFTLGVGLLSRMFGGIADNIGARSMLIVGPLGAALAYVWMALTQSASLTVGIIGPMALLGLSFAVLIAPLTASVMSSVDQSDEGLASGINNAASRIAQLTGVAIGAGVGSLASGYQLGLFAAAVLSAAGALTAAWKR
jgi:EmrB/QacA subfamily drug resistance transporter